MLAREMRKKERENVEMKQKRGVFFNEKLLNSVLEMKIYFQFFGIFVKKFRFVKFSSVICSSKHFRSGGTIPAYLGICKALNLHM